MKTTFKITSIIVTILLSIVTVSHAKDIIWDIETSFDNQIFPSYAFATSHLSNELSGNELGNFYGDGNAQIMVLFNELKKGQKVKIVATSPQIMEESVLEFEMAETRESFFAGLQLIYDWDKLLAWRQPKPTAFKVSVYVNDKHVGTKQKNIIVRSINDCLFMAANRFGVVSDLNQNYSAYVNENHPIISDKILPEVLNQGIIESILGYQSTEEDVLKQVYAVWHYFNKAKFNYSAMNSYYKSSNTFPVTQAQYVRTFTDIFNTRNANCVDGTILFASILMKMGINPYLITTPTHCYLAFNGLPSEGNVYFLETTLLGKDLNSADEETQNTIKSVSLTSSDDFFRLSMDKEKTYNNFIWALSVGTNNFINDQDKYKPEYENYVELVSEDSLDQVMYNLNYQKISVAKHRKDGLLPLSL